MRRSRGMALVSVILLMALFALMLGVCARDYALTTRAVRANDERDEVLLALRGAVRAAVGKPMYGRLERRHELGMIHLSVDERRVRAEFKGHFVEFDRAQGNWTQE